MINFRDLADVSKKLRKGKVFRSAGPFFKGTHPELSKIQTWIDLRTEYEWDGCALPTFPRRIPVPMDLADDIFLKEIKPTRQDWGGMYRRGFDRCLPSFAEILEFILSEPKPILFSCAVGRDRTGVTAAFLLHLLGVEREAILADYCRTSEAARDLTAFGSGLFDRRGLSDQEILDTFYVCGPEAMTDLLVYFTKQESELIDRLSTHGFDQAKLARLRRELTIN